MSEKIDFVIMWVDGNELNWKTEKNKYLVWDSRYYDNEDRYRNWENLKYWFRGVEKFAPFVNRIHFITEGHLPKWLNTNHPKLNIVKHSEYIPKKYLPTFNANPIEINIHRIKELSEHFVLFNDDMFLTNYVKETDFFIHNKPVDDFFEEAIISDSYSHIFQHILLNCISIINKNFNKENCIKRYSKKYLEKFNLNFKETFINFSNAHLPQSFNKSTFEEVWKKEKKILTETSNNKFRSIYDVSQYLFRDWQIASKNIVIRENKIGKFFSIEDHLMGEIVSAIKNQFYKEICINDVPQITNFEHKKKIIQESFESILPYKSEFEI